MMAINWIVLSIEWFDTNDFYFFYDFYWLYLLEGIVPNKSEQVLMIDFSGLNVKCLNLTSQLINNCGKNQNQQYSLFCFDELRCVGVGLTERRAPLLTTK